MFRRTRHQLNKPSVPRPALRPDNPLSRALSACWAMNASGLMVLDSSPNGIDGAWNGTPQRSSSPWGEAVGGGGFDNTNYIQGFTNASRLPQNQDNRTTSVLFRCASSTPGVESLFTYGDNSINGCRWNMVLVSNFPSGGQYSLMIEVRNDSYHALWTPDTNWHVWTAVFPSFASQASAIKIYLDGVEMSGSGGSQALFTNTANCLIGNDGFSDPFHGTVAGVWVWARPLQPGEVQSHAADPFQMLARPSVLLPMDMGHDGLFGFSGIPSSAGVGSGGTVTTAIIGSSGIPTSSGTGTTGAVSTGQSLVGSSGIPSSSGTGTTGAGLKLTLHGGTSGIPSSSGTGGESLNGAVGIGQILTPAGDGIPSSAGVGSGGKLTLTINRSTPATGIPSSAGTGSGGRLARGVGGIRGIPSSAAVGLGGTVVGSSRSPLGVVVLIGGVARDLVLEGTISITLQLGRFTAQLTLHDPAGEYYPEEGDEIVIMVENVRWFGGMVEQTVVSSYHGTTTLQVQVQAVGYDSILDHAYITKSYPDGTTSIPLMLGDLLALRLSREHFSVGTLPDADLTIEVANSLDFVAETCRTFLDKIKEITGYSWYVDNYRRINFFDSTTTAAPFNLTDNDGNWLSETMSVTRNRSKYRNKQGIKLPAAIQSVFTDTFIGDGTIYQIYPTTYPLPDDPTQVQVTVNGNPMVVASFIDLSHDYDFCYPAGSGVSVIFYNPTKEAIHPWQSTDIIEVTYPAPSSNVYWYQDGVKIAARAGVEGGSGIWESVVDVQDLIAVPTAAHDYAKALVDTWGWTKRQCDYRTLQPGLFPGQIQTMSVTHPPISGDQVIDSVTIRDIDKTYWEYTVRSVDRPRGQNDAFFLSLIRRSGQPVNKTVDKYTFNLGQPIPGSTVPYPGLVLGNNLTNSIPILHDSIPYEINLYLTQPPASGNVTIRINVDGTSIHDGDLPTYASTDTGAKIFTNFPASLLLRKDQRLTIDITSVGDGTGTDTGVGITAVLKALPIGGAKGF